MGAPKFAPSIPDMTTPTTVRLASDWSILDMATARGVVIARGIRESAIPFSTLMIRAASAVPYKEKTVAQMLPTASWGKLENKRRLVLSNRKANAIRAGPKNLRKNWPAPELKAISASRHLAPFLAFRVAEAKQVRTPHVMTGCKEDLSFFGNEDPIAKANAEKDPSNSWSQPLSFRAASMATTPPSITFLTCTAGSAALPGRLRLSCPKALSPPVRGAEPSPPPSPLSIAGGPAALATAAVVSRVARNPPIKMSSILMAGAGPDFFNIFSKASGRIASGGEKNNGIHQPRKLSPG
mmetsp:Transcript_54917/g.134627  ORF Transcript_54917/g.134627 Transcript_54917/m.134627 type:complete len:296 (+) Transcript_54917:372-1259(+)